MTDNIANEIKRQIESRSKTDSPNYRNICLTVEQWNNVCQALESVREAPVQYKGSDPVDIGNWSETIPREIKSGVWKIECDV